MKKRYRVLVSDSLLLIFLGLVYAWSIFKKPLAAAYGWNDSQLTWTFTICMFMFCIGGFAGAQITKHIPHMTVTLVCAVLMGGSFALMGTMTALWQIYVLYGVIIGFTVGAVYNCVLATGNRWFPDKGGLVAGLLLMFFGAGSLFLSPLSNWLMASFGIRRAFTVIGIMFLFVFIMGSFFVVSPNEKEGEELKKLISAEDKPAKKMPPDFETKEMLKTGSFWMYMLWCVMVSTIGIALLGQIATISDFVGMSGTKAALMVSLFAVFNGLGRLFFGGFYDKKGRLLTMSIFGVFFTIAAVALLFGVTKASVTLIIVAFVLFGIAYGGVTPTNANFARSFFGNKNYATNFSLVNFNLLVTVFLGQFVGSTLYMKTGNYTATAIAILILSVLSLILQFFIKPAKQPE
ncbi:MAG: MFS transporter [Clostridia bacterium]|nr:MFS transporter [Clostridia bacterium]MBR6479431.1 MFS transporter [Clostridia bacterium]MBR6512896.1 MFS transporter [Clostridia bacterium]